MSKNKTKRFLEISFALILVILLSSHAFIYEALAIQWQKIFQEIRQWQIAADATLTTLVPGAGTITAGGDGTDSADVRNEANSGCTVVTCADSIDDDPDSHDIDTTFNQNSGFGDLQQFYQLTDMPSDFSSMGTLDVDVAVKRVGTYTDDAVELLAQVFESNETAALTNEVSIGTWAGLTTSYQKINKAFTLQGNNTKTVWDGARLRLRWDYTKSKASDDLQLRVTAVEHDGTYNVAVNNPPTIGPISLQGTGVTTITLVEGSAVDIMASAQITDQQGCTDVRDGGGVKAIVYLYNTYTASCSQDNNNCYNQDIVSCSWQSTTGNTCNYECTASSAMYYYADPTLSNGGTASKSDEEWAVTIIASDSYWEDVTSNSWDPGASGSTSAEVALLLALDASTSINFQTVNPDQESSNIETTVKNTGNRAMNPLVSGTVMNGPGTNISQNSQQYSLVAFTTDSGTSLSGSATTLDTVTPQRTDDNDEVDDQIFWALYVPSGQTPGSYSGTNTLTADPD